MEQLTLTITGRDAISVSKYTPQVVHVDQDPPTKAAALLAIIDELYDEDKMQGLNEPEFMRAMAEKIAAEGEADAIQNEANEQKLSSRQRFRDKVQKQLDMARNNLNFSLDDLIQLQFAMKQLDDPKSCDSACLRAVSEVCGTVNKHRLTMMSLIDQESATLAAERDALLAGNDSLASDSAIAE